MTTGNLQITVYTRMNLSEVEMVELAAMLSEGKREEVLARLWEATEVSMKPFAVGGVIEDGFRATVMCEGPGPEIATIPKSTEMFDLNGLRPSQSRILSGEHGPELIMPIRVRVESVIYDDTSVHSANTVYFRTREGFVGKCGWMPEYGRVAFGSIVDLVMDLDKNILSAKVIA